MTDRVSIHFHKFDSAEYAQFIRAKALPESEIIFDDLTETYTLTTSARFAHMLGLEAPTRPSDPLALNENLFDYERDIVQEALAAKRYAVWADCGLGKTFMFLEFARQVTHRTGGKVLIFSPLQIISQTIDEAARWYGDSLAITHITSRADMIDWADKSGIGIAITNYEKMIPRKGQDEVVLQLKNLAGVICDESSVLKTGGGKIKWAIIKSCRGIEYKLSCTATPAPNEVMEYASQAAFLEKIRSEGDVLWKWFKRDKYGNWYIVPHGIGQFYRFLAGWSIYLRHPGRFGWKDNTAEIPKPIMIEHDVAPTSDQERAALEWARENSGDMVGGLKLSAVDRAKLSQIAKGFIYTKGKSYDLIDSHKPGYVADIIEEEVEAGHKVLVWTIFDTENDLLEEALEGSGVAIESLHGRIPKAKRQPIIDRFRRGETDVLISKASLLGYGVNFQHVTSMIFSGWNDSFEQFYQAIRRAYRYGQTKRLRVHIPVIRSLEDDVLSNVKRKQTDFEKQTSEHEYYYLQALNEIRNRKDIA